VLTYIDIMLTLKVDIIELCFLEYKRQSSSQYTSIKESAKNIAFNHAHFARYFIDLGNSSYEFNYISN